MFKRSAVFGLLVLITYATRTVQGQCAGAMDFRSYGQCLGRVGQPTVTQPITTCPSPYVYSNGGCIQQAQQQILVNQMPCASSTIPCNIQQTPVVIQPPSPPVVQPPPPPVVLPLPQPPIMVPQPFPVPQIIEKEVIRTVSAPAPQIQNHTNIVNTTNIINNTNLHNVVTNINNTNVNNINLSSGSVSSNSRNESSQVVQKEQEEDCCIIVEPRKCTEVNNEQRCYQKRYHACGSECYTTPTEHIPEPPPRIVRVPYPVPQPVRVEVPRPYPVPQPIPQPYMMPQPIPQPIPQQYTIQQPIMQSIAVPQPMPIIQQIPVPQSQPIIYQQPSCGMGCQQAQTQFMYTQPRQGCLSMPGWPNMCNTSPVG